jgi:3-methyladenine DNA glycosylase AlkD
MTAKEIIQYMESLQNDKQRRILMGFFKTGPGEYGEGDEFLGLKVPQTREVVKAVPKDFPLSEMPELLMNRWHEVRLCGLLILVAKFEKLATKRLENEESAIKGRDEILTLYLQYAEQANNWDLVDLSVHKILGHWLLLPTNLGDKDYKIKLLDDLAQSSCLWKQRMSIVCSWKTSQMGDPSWCLRYAEIHLHHPHDLMHKAVGWMLREMGKRVSMDLLRDFLRQHAHEMPRTMLRYAIEKMPEQERQYWLNIPQDFAPAKKSKVNRFAGIPVSDFLDMILKGDDEAMYYLLNDRLNRLLQERFEPYRHQLCDDFEDVVEDFFLYLRESGRTPYQSLQRIKNREAFESWLLTTFRNYLSNRVEAEGLGVCTRFSDNSLIDATDEPSELTDEQKIDVVSQLIAYAHQVFYPRGRFIFLRSMLTMLNKQRAVPNNEMAEALDMSYLAYRVTLHHMKQNIKRFRERLLRGESLRLDTQHEQIAKEINADFTHLYPTLFRYYLETIDTLKTSTAVKHLRQQYLEEHGLIVHEPDPNFPIRVRIPSFWESLSQWVIT